MNISYKYIHTNISILVLSLFLFSCDTHTKAEEEEHHHDDEGKIELTQAQYEQAHIQLGAITKRIMGSELHVNGVIDVPPQSNISINMLYGGFIKYIDMLPGTPIKKGQLLVTLENPEFIQFQQDYLESLAQQEYLKAEYERQEELYEEKVASGKNYQQAKSAYLANEARLKTTEARLKMIGLNPASIKSGKITSYVGLYAPVNGQVREVYANIGKYVNPQDVIMDITNSEDLHVELTVYENDIPKVKNEQKIRFSLADAPDHWREAEVFLIGSGVREDRSVTVHGHLKQHETDLLPGMYVTARIETGNRDAMAVPEESVVRFNGSHYIFALDDKRTEQNTTVYDFIMLEVSTGVNEDGFTEINLKDKTMDQTNLDVVTSGAFTVLAKAKNTEEEGGHGH